jgi:hypothetical protein
MKNRKLQPEVTTAPRAMQVQLARLFGSDSKEARCAAKSTAEWRKTLKSVVHEIDRYIAHNIGTDELHRWMLLSGLAAADESLNEKHFGPGYAEGITGLALTLLGDYPDHCKRKPGRKKDDHYKLDRLRSMHWTQTPNQRLQTLLAVGIPRVS